MTEDFHLLKGSIVNKYEKRLKELGLKESTATVHGVRCMFLRGIIHEETYNEMRYEKLTHTVIDFNDIFIALDCGDDDWIELYESKDELVAVCYSRLGTVSVTFFHLADERAFTYFHDSDWEEDWNKVIKERDSLSAIYLAGEISCGEYNEDLVFWRKKDC